MIDHELFVEPDTHASTHLDDTQSIPLSGRFIGFHQRVFACSACTIIPKPTTALIGSMLPSILIFRIPYLHLRNVAEIDTGVAFGRDFVFEAEFDVAVILQRRNTGAMAVSE